jgi:glycosyltransferase involved in cell wall biosynthesis
MRFTWLSNAPFAPSGYGQQTRINVPRLANEKTGHQCGVICYYGLEGGVLQVTPNITLFPKRYHPYGNDIAVSHTQNFGARILMSLTDVWVMNVEEYPRDILWVPWFPVDHEPMPAVVRGKLNSAWKRIAMSKYGQTEARRQGLDCHYVPHSIETDILKPLDKTESRAALGIPQDKWVVGIVAMNKGVPSRKNFVEQIAAFAKCKTRHKDWFLFLQTDPGVNMGDMVNLPELCGNYGLKQGEDYGFCNQYFQAVGFPPPYFAQLYSSLDVLLMVTAGEGFGIPTIEAQACGCPVIGGGWMATPELIKSGRVIDKKDAEPYYSQFAANLYKPHIRAIELALEEEHRKPSKPRVAEIKAEYDADIVYEKHWMPILAEMERDLEGAVVK